MYFLFDPVYLLFLLPALLISLITTCYVKSTFSKYSNVRGGWGLTGAQAAEKMLHSAGVYDVRIERTGGFLSDHFDPTENVLRLSSQVYDKCSIAAIGVACHEAGHAIQKAQGYAWLGLRTALVPAVNFGSSFSYIILVIGFLFRSQSMVGIGCALFALVVLFAIVTLPVEWDASARAKRAMATGGVLMPGEDEAAGSVLNAAFMTYVASAFSALMTLLYYLYRSGLLGGRRR